MEHQPANKQMWTPFTWELRQIYHQSLTLQTSESPLRHTINNISKLLNIRKDHMDYNSAGIQINRPCIKHTM